MKLPAIIEKLDREFHSDHDKLNRQLKKAGLKIRYPKIKK
jgi:hypothetical protein|tara:strand:+ start:131 stop:250 length:120 start_codon:yes stop_codon:yes gene_type:complete